VSNNPNVRIRRGRRAGFSLVELALAVLMLAMLAVVAVPRYTTLANSNDFKRELPAISNESF
jgi:prepilin-type N-terminal cleavage/methylation domain-containing protein